jgi:hypothetical protein
MPARTPCPAHGAQQQAAAGGKVPSPFVQQADNLVSPSRRPATPGVCAMSVPDDGDRRAGSSGGGMATGTSRVCCGFVWPGVAPSGAGGTGHSHHSGLPCSGDRVRPQPVQEELLVN